jgi:hypothetical protein
MISKQIIMAVLFTAVLSCERQDLTEVQTIRDLSKPQSLFYTIQRNRSKIRYKIRGTMNGTLGYYNGNCFDREAFSTFIKENNLSRVDTARLHIAVRIFEKSIMDTDSIETSQEGTMFCLRFIPGTATKGTIEVEFTEYGYGTD